MALARDRLVADDLAAGTLIRPFGDRHVAVADSYWIVTPENAVQRQAVATVIDWLRSQSEAGPCSAIPRETLVEIQ